MRLHLTIIAGALAGLHHAHEMVDFDGAKFDIVHRDVSPQNVLVTFNGQTKVLDFGIAKASLSSVHTHSGLVKGKVRYMAPEQMQARSLDRRADLFAIGVMLWEAVTGRRMWSHHSDVGVLQRVMAGMIPKLDGISPYVSKDLADICNKALAFDPKQRFQTALEIERALDAYLRLHEEPVTSQELGQFVSELFAVERRQVKQIIESEVKRAQSISASEFQTSHPVDLSVHRPIDDQDNKTESTPTKETTDSGATAEPPPYLNSVAPESSISFGPGDNSTHPASSRLRAAVVALIVIGFAAPLAFLLVRRPLDFISAPATSESAAHLAVKGAKVVVRIQASPAVAKLYFDDIALAQNPDVVVREADFAVHKVRAQADGFLSKSVDITLDWDTNVVLTLDCSSSCGERPDVAQKLAKPVSTRVPHSASSGKVDCSSPWYVDDKGVKRALPDCL
jgi:serine/threonine-protein kinase